MATVLIVFGSWPGLLILLALLSVPAVAQAQDVKSLPLPTTAGAELEGSAGKPPAGRESNGASQPLPTGRQRQNPLRAPVTALVIGSGLDLGTTLYALQTGAGREANPFLAHGGTPGLLAGKAASTAVLLWGLRRLARDGHPTVAKWIGWTGGIALSGVALHNARVAHR